MAVEKAPDLHQSPLPIPSLSPFPLAWDPLLPTPPSIPLSRPFARRTPIRYYWLADKGRRLFLRFPLDVRPGGLRTGGEIRTGGREGNGEEGEEGREAERGMREKGE